MDYAIWKGAGRIARNAMIQYAENAKLDLEEASKIAQATEDEVARRSVERALEKVKSALAELRLS